MAAAVAAVRRVHAPCAAELRELVALCEPFVATGLIDSWASRGWTPEVLEQSFGSTSICVRLYPRSSLNAGSAGVPTDAIGASNVPFEGECVYVQATMGEFSQWLRHGGTSSTVPLPPSSPFLRFPRDVYWGYSDYQDMKALFAQTAPEALAAVDWSSIGLQHVAASALADHIPRCGLAQQRRPHPAISTPMGATLLRSALAQNAGDCTHRTQSKCQGLSSSAVAAMTTLCVVPLPRQAPSSFRRVGFPTRRALSF